MPLISQKLVDFFQGGVNLVRLSQNENTTINPDQIVAYGATKLARGLTNGDLPVILQDVTPLTYSTGIEVTQELRWYERFYRQLD